MFSHSFSFNIAVEGAEALLAAGANPSKLTEPPYAGESPLAVARGARARGVEAVLMKYGAK